MFHQERARILLNRRNRESFAQIIGEHALHMCELAQADASNQKKALMSKWVDIHKINDEWASLVTWGDRPDSEFSQVASRLIHLYSETLADCILDKLPANERIEELVTTERKFFDALGHGGRSSQREWVAYTGGVIEMMHTLLRHGEESKSFDVVAGQCIRNGVLLGAHLDHCIFRRSKR